MYTAASLRTALSGRTCSKQAEEGIITYSAVTHGSQTSKHGKHVPHLRDLTLPWQLTHLQIIMPIMKYCIMNVSQQHVLATDPWNVSIFHACPSWLRPHSQCRVANPRLPPENRTHLSVKAHTLAQEHKLVGECCDAQPRAVPARARPGMLACMHVSECMGMQSMGLSSAVMRPPPLPALNCTAFQLCIKTHRVVGM